MKINSLPFTINSPITGTIAKVDLEKNKIIIQLSQGISFEGGFNSISEEEKNSLTVSSKVSIDAEGNITKIEPKTNTSATNAGRTGASASQPLRCTNI